MDAPRTGSQKLFAKDMSPSPGLNTAFRRIVRAELVWDPFGDLEPFDSQFPVRFGLLC